MWELKGTANHIDKPCLLKYFEKVGLRDILSTSEKVFPDHQHNWIKNVYRLSSKANVNKNFKGIFNLPEDKLESLHQGDILKLCPDGKVMIEWEASSDQNVLYITEACNSNCVMCPQPRNHEDHSDEVLHLLSMLQTGEIDTVCISGGEPTLGKQIFEILELLSSKKPQHTIMLTNGRMFKSRDFVQKIISTAPHNMVYGIPLYSSVPQIHDRIVGSKGAFKETITGIYNLTEFFKPIELRIVLTRQTIEGLENLAEFIGWNLPMAVHVAFMGMEVHGNAQLNEQKVWIEPKDYMDALVVAVRELVRRNIFVSIYNLPLCLLPKSLWKFSVKSISDWKMGYQKECSICSKRNECAGFFTTSDIVPLGIKHLE